MKIVSINSVERDPKEIEKFEFLKNSKHFYPFQRDEEKEEDEEILF